MRLHGTMSSMTKRPGSTVQEQAAHHKRQALAGEMIANHATGCDLQAQAGGGDRPLRPQRAVMGMATGWGQGNKFQTWAGGGTDPKWLGCIPSGATVLAALQAGPAKHDAHL